LTLAPDAKKDAAGVNFARQPSDVRLDRVTKRFDDVVAVDGISLEIPRGSFFALLGPSGCGKTTTLRMIGGFDEPDEGTIFLGDRAVTGLPPHKRDVNTVFQSYALFPHLTIFENVAFGLRRKGIKGGQLEGRVREILGMVDLTGLGSRKPRQLSGGQQQRIALARALAVDPKILLLDEPFGALDKNLRLDMQIEVKRLQREYGITAILVTHDQEEALSMADRIAVMNRGRVEQLSSPTDVYDRPQTVFVNQFVGTTNLLHGELADEALGIVRLEGGALMAAAPAPGLRQGAPVVLSVRPEQLRIHSAHVDGAVAATIRVVLPLGPHVMYEARTDAGVTFRISAPRDAGARLLSPGERVHVAPVAPRACNVFAAESERAA
jgi:ABC-type Fe3+/spermidine/putrescine transport system ATPase subunit